MEKKTRLYPPVYLETLKKVLGPKYVVVDDNYYYDIENKMYMGQTVALSWNEFVVRFVESRVLRRNVVCHGTALVRRIEE